MMKIPNCWSVKQGGCSLQKERGELNPIPAELIKASSPSPSKIKKKKREKLPEGFSDYGLKVSHRLSATISAAHSQMQKGRSRKLRIISVVLF